VSRRPRRYGPDFLADATRRLRGEGLTVNADGQQRLHELYYAAADRLESAEVRREGAAALRLARANQTRLLNAIVNAAHDEHRDIVDRFFIDRVLAGICPLFPFC